MKLLIPRKMGFTIPISIYLYSAKLDILKFKKRHQIAFVGCRCILLILKELTADLCTVLAEIENIIGHDDSEPFFVCPFPI